MQHLFMVFRVVAGLSFLPLWRRSRQMLVWLSSIFCALWIVGCGSTLPATAERPIPPVQVHGLCWQPKELGPKKTNTQFVFADDGKAIAEGEPGFGIEVARGGFVFKYAEDAPAKNLRLVPMVRVDAWCTRIPKPTDPEVLRLLDPNAQSTSMGEEHSATKNLLGQTEVPTRSPYFCGKQPRLAPTTLDSISLFRRVTAYQEAHDYAEAVAKALTEADAQMQAVINKSDSWLKQALTSNPGTVEQIQQGVADTLDAIEAPPECDEPFLEPIVLAGWKAGYDDGKFEAEAKIFAIDAGVMLIEFAAMEVALGPLGGAKLIASAVSKGAKVLTVATTKGGKVLAAAMQRLENIPIFIPGAANGIGGFVTVGKILGPISARMHRSLLANALKNSVFKFKKQLWESTHHIVPLESNRKWAPECRKLFNKFKLEIDAEYNGVFLPRYKKSPNPGGAIVHATLDNEEYYRIVAEALGKATSQAEAIQTLRRIRETLLNGTFYHAVL